MDLENVTAILRHEIQEQGENGAYIAALNDDGSVVEIEGTLDLGLIAAKLLQSIDAGQAPHVSINLQDVSEETAERVTALAALLEQMVRATEGKFGFTINMVGDVLQASVTPVFVGMDLAKEGAERTARHTVYGTVCETCEQEYRWVEGEDEGCPHCIIEQLKAVQEACPND